MSRTRVARNPCFGPQQRAVRQVEVGGRRWLRQCRPRPGWRAPVDTHSNGWSAQVGEQVCNDGPARLRDVVAAVQVERGELLEVGLQVQYPGICDVVAVHKGEGSKLLQLGHVHQAHIRDAQAAAQMKAAELVKLGNVLQPVVRDCRII